MYLSFRLSSYPRHGTCGYCYAWWLDLFSSTFLSSTIGDYRSPENDEEPSNTDENHDVNQGSNGHDEAPRVQRSRRARASSAISHGLSVLFPICQSVDAPAPTRTISRTSSVNQAPIAQSTGCLPIFGRSRSASGTPPALIPTRTPEYTRTPTRSASGTAPAHISARTPEYPHTPTSSASGTAPARIPGYPHTPALTSVTAPTAPQSIGCLPMIRCNGSTIELGPTRAREQSQHQSDHAPP